jgi:hypothetical protein
MLASTSSAQSQSARPTRDTEAAKGAKCIRSDNAPIISAWGAEKCKQEPHHSAPQQPTGKQKIPSNRAKFADTATLANTPNAYFQTAGSGFDSRRAH